MSAKDEIIALPNDHLRQPSKRVAVVNDEVRAVIDKMKAATIDWEDSRPHELGVALAAVQIDQPLKIIIIRNNFENKDDKTFSVFINPEIVKLEGQLEEDFEGCLSVKNTYGKVPRYSKVRLRALDENGREVRVKAEGFLARVIQHEVDHTKGLVFVDHIHDHPEAFYRLDDKGKLNKLAYEEVQKSGVLDA